MSSTTIIIPVTWDRFLFLMNLIDNNETAEENHLMYDSYLLDCELGIDWPITW